MIKNEDIFFELQDDESKNIRLYDTLKNITTFNYSRSYRLGGLINLSTDTIKGEVREYSTSVIDYSFIQTYDVIDDNVINLVNVKKVRIYDALNEELLCDN